MDVLTKAKLTYMGNGIIKVMWFINLPRASFDPMLLCRKASDLCVHPIKPIDWEIEWVEEIPLKAIPYNWEAL